MRRNVTYGQVGQHGRSDWGAAIDGIALEKLSELHMLVDSREINIQSGYRHECNEHLLGGEHVLR